MSLYDFNSPRLYVDAKISKDSTHLLDRDQSNYLINVMRLRAKEHILVFNGQDGEWNAELVLENRKSVCLLFKEQIRPQTPAGELIYLFAPIKHARLDYMIQKAVEMGVNGLRPVFTRRTQVNRVNVERMRANAIEAAEQCGVLNIPQILPEMKIAAALEELGPDCLLIFCDENAPVRDPVANLQQVRDWAGGVAVLIGPEGGFAEEERAMIDARKPCLKLSLGPRILRADTAAVAALALVQAAIGDWV